MKKLLMVSVIAMAWVSCCFSNALAGSLEDFTQSVHVIEKEFISLWDGLGDALEKNKTLSAERVKSACDKIEAEAKKIIALGKKENKPDWVFCSDELAEVAEEVSAAFDKGESEEAIFNLTNGYHHFNMLQITNPQFNRYDMNTHFEEVRAALKKGDLAEAAELAEHMEGHARHIHFAARMFGKKVWRDFAKEAMEYADEVADACMEGNKAEAEAALAKLEKPVGIINKLVN